MDLDFTRSPQAPQSLREAVAPIVGLFAPDPGNADAATLSQEGRHDVVHFGGYTPTRRVTMADLRRIALAAQREDRVQVTREVGRPPVSAPELHEKATGPDAAAIAAMLRQSIEDGRKMVTDALEALRAVSAASAPALPILSDLARIMGAAVRMGAGQLAPEATARLAVLSLEDKIPPERYVDATSRTMRARMMYAAALAMIAIDAIDRREAGVGPDLGDPDFAEIRRG